MQLRPFVPPIGIAAFGLVVLFVAVFLPWGGMNTEDVECFGEGGCLGSRLELRYTPWELRIDGEHADGNGPRAEGGENHDWNEPILDDYDGIGRIEGAGTLIIIGLCILLLGMLVALAGLALDRRLRLAGAAAMTLGALLIVSATVLLVGGFRAFSADFAAEFKSGSETATASAFRLADTFMLYVTALAMALGGGGWLFWTELSSGSESPAVPSAAEPKRPVRAASFMRLRPARDPDDLVCPQCKSPVQVPAGARPACWTCGFSG